MALIPVLVVPTFNSDVAAPMLDSNVTATVEVVATNPTAVFPSPYLNDPTHVIVCH